MSKKVGVQKGVQNNNILSKNQQKILDYLTTNFYTVKHIARIENKTKWAVYKTIRKLKKKGLLKRGYKKNTKLGGVTKPEYQKLNQRTLRLHNIQIHIKILAHSNYYYKILKESNKISFSNCTIMLYDKYIEVYTQKGFSFTGYSSDECYSKALEFFSLFYSKLENRLKIVIDKDQYLNKKWVRQHIAETDNELAKDYNKRKEKLQIKAEDGKTWLLIDDSFNLKELELVHPKTAKKDTELIIEKHFNDIRENQPMTNSEIQSRLSDIVVILEKLTKQIGV